MTGVYIFYAAVFAFLVYISICLIWTARMRNLAMLLREVLDTKGWGDFVKIIKGTEYFEAVMKSCEIVLAETK